jgi:hypothetical protein
MGFAKPMSMNHRRRISRDASGQSADDMGHQEVLVAARFKRSQSVSSIPRHERPDSPSVDNSSFLLKSPPGQLEPDDSLEDIHSACDNTIQVRKRTWTWLTVDSKGGAQLDQAQAQRHGRPLGRPAPAAR